MWHNDGCEQNYLVLWDSFCIDKDRRVSIPLYCTVVDKYVNICPFYWKFASDKISVTYKIFSQMHTIFQHFSVILSLLISKHCLKTQLNERLYQDFPRNMFEWNKKWIEIKTYQFVEKVKTIILNKHTIPFRRAKIQHAFMKLYFFPVCL